MKNGLKLPDGIIAMLVTPFNQTQGIDFGALRAQIDWCACNGAKGVVVTPSIGEFAVLSEVERIQCFEVCKAHVERHHPNLILIATIASTNSYDTAQYARYAKGAGYDAAQLNPPYYWIPDEEEVYRFYCEVAEIGLPIVVYNNPMLSKFDITARVAGRLADIPGVVAMKEVKTDRHKQLEPLFETLQGRIKIYTTFRAFTTGLWLRSSGGFINAFALPFCVKMWELFEKGDPESFRRMEEIQNMVNIVFPRGGEDNKRHIGTTKMAVSVVTGINMGSPRAPYLLPDLKFEKILRENLPALYDLCS